MQKQSSKISVIGIVISSVLLFNLWSFQLVVADTLRPIEIALGNWAPVIEEKRSGHGALADKITIVLQRMGYQPTYSFMPWDQAALKVSSNEADSGPRITLPYLKTAEREALFLYSEKPVFPDCMKFFYHKGKITNPEMTRLTKLDNLDRYRIGYRKKSPGFQYPYKLSKILEAKKNKGFDGLYDAFERLTTNDAKDVQVVPASQVIGEHLLIELFPDAREKIALLQETTMRDGSDCLLPVDYYLLVSRKNPNNTEFMDRFNQEFDDLKADKETEARIKQSEEERGSLSEPLVRLDGSSSNLRVLADTNSGKRIHVPRGSRGILLNWSSAVGSQHATATVRLISGPYRGIVVTLSGDHLRLE